MQRADRVARCLARVRAVAASRDLPGVVLTAPGPVAWATAGLNAPIDRTAGTDVVWLAVGPDRATVVTTAVEAPRLAGEQDLGTLGLDLVAAPWWDAGAMVTAAAGALGAPAARLGADGHPGFGHDVGHDLTRARLDLGPQEQEALLALGVDATAAVEDALRGWTPGERDRDVVARVAAAVEAAGADAPVLLVGGDDRLGRWRHPVAVGAPLERVVMVVLVARRDGLHVALTRYAAAGPLDPALARGLDVARAVHRDVLAACRPGATVGDVLGVLDASYAAHGHPRAWEQHYQGGPIGWGQREFEIAPCQRDDPWWAQPLLAGTAVAWNPSVPGGGKDEDTYLVTADGVRAVTAGSGWPAADDAEPARPGVLQLA